MTGRYDVRVVIARRIETHRSSWSAFFSDTLSDSLICHEEENFLFFDQLRRGKFLITDVLD